MAKRYGKKVLAVMVIGAFLIMGMSSLVMAQVSPEIKDAAKKMSDAWKKFEDGQHTVVKGLAMNKQVATQLGFADLLTPGNKTIASGRDSVLTGAKSFAQGQKYIMEHPNDPKVVKEGVDLLENGFKTAIGGKKTMEKGIAMNNEVAQSKGAMDKFAEGNKLVKEGMDTMGEAVREFMPAERMYLKAKNK
jgi:Na+-transporting methylmalonyl-CoA/oxaloacetate decarboxylase gamma subunit